MQVTTTLKDYGQGLRYIVFEHEGNHRGKMSGGVVKIYFPEISTSENDDQSTSSTV